MTPKKKIAILGGGMAGLSAAYELTRTPELRALHEVTLYQMGWRLGGKAASGRDALGRNLEHGLHVWFGCYANVFAMAQEIYANRTPPPGCPLQHWTDVAKPQLYTPIGVKTGTGFTYFPLTWPTNGGTPGQGGLDMTPAEAWTTMWNLFLLVVKGIIGRLDAAAQAAAVPAPQPLPGGFAASALVQLADGELARAKALFDRSQAVQLGFHELADAGGLWMKSLLAEPSAADPQHVSQLLDMHRLLQSAFRAAAARANPAPGTPLAIELQIVGELIDIAIAAAAGYFADLVLPDRPFESIDDIDFRAWLVEHGADPDIVANSTVTRIVYDTLFQYADGDVSRPSYAAGTALGVCARLLGTFKGAMMWDIQTGMGEAVVAPLYQALLDAGVKVQFFRKVTRLELSPDGQQIAAVHMDRQADVVRGDYRPTFMLESEKLVCWPSEPDWTQLVDGAQMKAAGVNFESHWCDWPAAGEEVLKLGSEFDTVVLAISMGAYKPLNGEPTMCDELLGKGGRFADFVQNIGIVATQALQLWSNQTLEELGWTSGKPATVSGPEYMNIWADMSQVLAVEPAVGFPKPKSLHYLCGTYATTLYRQPSSETGVPLQAWNELRTQTVGWLNDASACIWPAARTPEGKFRFDVLTDFSGSASGEARFDQQFLRANIDPTECCVLSAAGTTQYRLHPAESGFSNLILAGEATRHGFNTTAIEGAVMSGMAASRAICGQPATIVGYDFLQRKPSQHLE